MKVDEKRACPSCRAENPTSAEFCWQCFAPLVDIPAPPVPSGPGWGRPGARVLKPSPMPVAPGGPPAAGPGPAIAPEPTSSGVSLAIRIVLGVVGAALGYFLVGTLLGGGVSVPDTLGGLPRQTDDAAKDFESEMRAEGERWDLDVAGASYGRGSFPETMLILVEGRSLETTDQLFDALVGGMVEAGATIDTVESVTGTHDGADYRCVPVRGPGVDGSACIWHADDHVGIVLDLGNGANAAEGLLAEAHTAATA